MRETRLASISNNHLALKCELCGHQSMIACAALDFSSQPINQVLHKQAGVDVREFEAALFIRGYSV